MKKLEPCLLHLLSTKVIVEKSPPQDKKKAPKDTISNNEATSADDIVYEVAEPMPSFPDGMQALMTYLRRKTYPS